MKSVWTIFYTAMALCAFVASVMLSPWAALFIVVACAGFLYQACCDSRRIQQATAAIVPVDANMPAPYEIEAAVRRLRRILDSEGFVPDPPGGVDVHCEQCEVTEHYVYSSNAAESAHLLEHPERCRVTESEHGAPWLLEPIEARYAETIHQCLPLVRPLVADKGNTKQ
jgi:hypothetical protein